MENLKKIIDQKYYKESSNNEDGPILNFLKLLPQNKKFNLLDVGSGMGRFAAIIKKNFTNINLVCLEINKELAKNTKDMGIDTINTNFLHNDMPDEKFDIVHCSHVIEHFSYPEIKNVLDELVRITKKNGYIIIRSPLMHQGFYKDIDHFRPYPPNSIINYFNNTQQQKISDYKVDIHLIWFRKETLYFNFPLFRVFNILLKFFWIYFKFPYSRANGYVLILKKL